MELPFGYDWPYKEGLRMDEAMNPLTLLTFGCYGQTLPNQNGAPVRVIVPWKYGFKSAKSIVRFHFTDKQPRTTWNDTDGMEYGFYSNVNPNYDNARWSQAHERRIDSSLLPRTIPTLMFNGYSDQVASMYAGMDLKKLLLDPHAPNPNPPWLTESPSHAPADRRPPERPPAPTRQPPAAT